MTNDGDSQEMAKQRGLKVDERYTKQPRGAQFASVFYGIATFGGNQALQKAAPTREKADQLLNQRLSAPFHGDANDLL
jgi:homoserine O-acetyltransferase